MSRWFRHYAGMMRDDKLVRVAVRAKQPVERVVWVWGAMLESAAEINDAGRFDFDVDEAAYFLRCEPSDLSAIVAALCDLGRIDANRVTKWGDRQFESDVSKERQQRYRDRKKASPRDDSDVTTPSRDAEVTPQETEADTEPKTNRKTPSSVPDAVEAGASFDHLIDTFPQNPSSSETKARAAFERIKPAERPAVIAAAARFSKWFAQDCEARDRTVEAGLSFVPHLAKWLDSGAWREASSLPVKGEQSPDMAVVVRGDADFTALERFRGKPINVFSDDGRYTVTKAELEQARASVH